MGAVCHARRSQEESGGPVPYTFPGSALPRLYIVLRPFRPTQKAALFHTIFFRPGLLPHSAPEAARRKKRLCPDIPARRPGTARLPRRGTWPCSLLTNCRRIGFLPGTPAGLLSRSFAIPPRTKSACTHHISNTGESQGIFRFRAWTIHTKKEHRFYTMLLWGV